MISDKQTKILIVMEKDLKSWVQQKAAEDDRSMGNYIRHLVMQEKAKDEMLKSVQQNQILNEKGNGK